jgi:dTDP-4-amino-4,6-dideoxygalactose transaminase
VACFSLYVAHLLTAGVGGIATTDDPELAALMRSLVNHGRNGIYISIDDDDGATGDRLMEIITRRFSFERIGHSYRITELEAALALAQLDDWSRMIARRTLNAECLTAELADLRDRLQLPALRPHTDSAHMMYPIVVKGETKERFAAYLEEHGVETREMLRLSDQPCYKGLWNPAAYPVAQWINEHGLYIGCHNGLDSRDMERVAEIIRGYWKR